MARFLTSSILAAARDLRAVADRLPQARARTIGTLARRLPVEARRSIQSEYNITAARLRAGLIARRISDGVELQASRRPIGLRNFGRPTAGGFRVQVLKDGPAEVLRHAFLQTPGGAASRTGAQLFERALVAGKRAARYPIRRLHGPSVADMLARGDRPEQLAEHAQSLMRAEFARQLRY